MNATVSCWEEEGENEISDLALWKVDENVSQVERRTAVKPVVSINSEEGVVEMHM